MLENKFCSNIAPSASTGPPHFSNSEPAYCVRGTWTKPVFELSCKNRRDVESSIFNNPLCKQTAKADIHTLSNSKTSYKTEHNHYWVVFEDCFGCAFMKSHMILELSRYLEQIGIKSIKRPSKEADLIYFSWKPETKLEIFLPTRERASSPNG